MENASKALLIAGGFLIGILLASFMMFLFKSLSASSSDLYESMTSSQITEHNQKFLAFEVKDGNDNNYLTPQDVITIINLAKDHNAKPKVPTTVSVYMENFSGVDNNIDLAVEENDKIVLDNNKDFIKYNYIFSRVEFNHNLVSKIYIEKVDI